LQVLMIFCDPVSARDKYRFTINTASLGGRDGVIIGNV